MIFLVCVLAAMLLPLAYYTTHNVHRADVVRFVQNLSPRRRSPTKFVACDNCGGTDRRWRFLGGASVRWVWRERERGRRGWLDILARGTYVPRVCPGLSWSRVGSEHKHSLSNQNFALHF